jgi:preprotein translocase subunit YajC
MLARELLGLLGGPLTMSTGAAQIFFLLLLVAFFYFLIVRPQRTRMRAQQELQSSLELGDEIVTFAGFFGTIRRFDGDVVTIELSPGVEARLNRRAISGKVSRPMDDSDESHYPDEPDEPEATQQ